MKNRPWSEAGKAQKAKVSSKLAGTWVLFNSLSYALSSLPFLSPLSPSKFRFFGFSCQWDGHIGAYVAGFEERSSSGTWIIFNSLSISISLSHPSSLPPLTFDFVIFLMGLVDFRKDRTFWMIKRDKPWERSSTLDFPRYVDSSYSLFCLFHLAFYKWKP